MIIDEVLIPTVAILVLSILTGALVWWRQNHLTKIRINVIWVSTLVAILTLTFGNRLISLLTDHRGQGVETIEIVLSSLVGVGIGGLIAIAGQLVEDSPRNRGKCCCKDGNNGCGKAADKPSAGKSTAGPEPDASAADSSADA